MFGTSERRVGIWLLGIAFLAGGCQSSTTTSSSSPSVRIVPAIEPADTRLTGDQAKMTSEFLGDLLKLLNDGKLTEKAFTLAFRKAIAPVQPGNEDARKLGYDPRKMEEFLQKINTGEYSSTFTFLPSTEGPYVLGDVATKAGGKEGYFIHLVPAEGSKDWQIGWFHRSKAASSIVTDVPVAQLVGAQMAAQRFMDNLLSGNLPLAEAALAASWKIREYPSKAPSDADRGYNQSLVLQKLRGWQGDYAGYAFADRQLTPGKPATFVIVALDAKSNVKKSFALKVEKGPGNEWFVGEVEVE